MGRKLQNLFPAKILKTDEFRLTRCHVTLSVIQGSIFMHQKVTMFLMHPMRVSGLYETQKGKRTFLHNRGRVENFTGKILKVKTVSRFCDIILT